MKYRKYISAGLLALGLQACQNAKQDVENGPGRWAQLPVPITVTEEIADSEAAMNDVLDAMEFWEAKAGKSLFALQGVWSSSQEPVAGNFDQPSQIFANAVFFPMSWPMSGDIAGKTTLTKVSGRFQQGFVVLNRYRSYCFGDCQGDYQRVSFRRLIAHELGHFIGLPHSAQNPQDIMQPVLAPGGDLNSVTFDTATLLSLTR